MASCGFCGQTAWVQVLVVWLYNPGKVAQHLWVSVVSLDELDDIQEPSVISFNCLKNTWHQRGSYVTRDRNEQMFNMEDVTGGMFWC